MLRLVAALVLVAAATGSSVAEDPGGVDEGDGWIVGDFTRARAIAAESRRPLLVVFRCVP